MKKGYRGKITDVEGICVGHKAIAADNIQTGVTIVPPTEGGIFREELTVSCHVINGFGKTGGLIQLEEPGVLESPIVLINMLCVGIVQQALVCYMLQDHPEIGMTNGAVNVMVGEYNDGYLNNTRACSIQESNVYGAIADTERNFALGAVGAGRNTSCPEIKGGISPASRVLGSSEEEYTVGLLVLPNSRLKSGYVRENVSFHDSMKGRAGQGSTIIILVTDIPMSDRQLKHVYKRIPVALARPGSHLGNGSGDIAIALSTTNKIPHSADCSFILRTILHEQQADKVFHTGIEACEEAIQSSLDTTEAVVRKEGHRRYNLKDTVAKVKEG